MRLGGVWLKRALPFADLLHQRNFGEGLPIVPTIFQWEGSARRVLRSGSPKGGVCAALWAHPNNGDRLSTEHQYYNLTSETMTSVYS